MPEQLSRHRRPALLRTGSNRRILAGLTIATAAALLLGLASPGYAEPRATTSPAADSVERAMARDFGISVAEAERRLTSERTAGPLAAALVARLGARSGGAYLDRNGKLIVAVTDAAAAQTVIGNGAQPKLVRFSAQQLAETKRGLDAVAQRSGAGKAQSWGVDVATNTVLVTVQAGAEDRATTRFLTAARAGGAKVRVQRATGSVRPVANLYGGQQVQMSSGYVCSVGFNAKTAAGAKVMITAGHCAEGRPLFSRNGVVIGSTRAVSFPGNDYAAVNISSAWTPRGAVDKYDGTARVVKGFSQATVGSSVCKSGRTTGWTCGTIQAYNQTVNYGNGDIVSGLARYNACVEPGDSGGSNISGNLAQGVSSGGALYERSPGVLVCGAKVGEPNESFYQPIGEILKAYGLSLITE